MTVSLRTETDYLSDQNTRLLTAYLDAKEFVIDSGYAWEIDWQWDVANTPPTESDVLREAAWVILCSGFRESVVRDLFEGFSKAFLYWASSAEIRRHSVTCRRQALRVFGNHRKVDAICNFAVQVDEIGFSTVLQELQVDSIKFLQTFDHIGPVTSYHLAKNLGALFSKPDRHLERVSQAVGFANPQDLCHVIAESMGDPVPVVDVVIWRFATLRKDYVKVFQTAIS